MQRYNQRNHACREPAFCAAPLCGLGKAARTTHDALAAGKADLIKGSERLSVIRLSPLPQQPPAAKPCKGQKNLTASVWGGASASHALGVKMGVIEATLGDEHRAPLQRMPMMASGRLGRELRSLHKVDGPEVRA
eukprot:CAMPEP_0177577006 /NCGR_PEP_ID=MMETSP0369-20130122/80418_1 /TAXON_ID=447022 ORGANISM="Scrippsiella hangoei-like, Strain SHHI-4" /NCGR_SAMPLE_ID=MMETSP0369 /ASSEMBLY_ACC=CAM_ASM_000364 /LENGTH=134 /DNA_ID=CAMNT_0019065331 /DNA_START=76 /DNA_END=478 /DNA_ORIENTATION=-